MSAPLPGMTTIRWCVTGPDGKEIWGSIAIDAERAAGMWPGRPPMDFDAFGAYHDWQKRVERSDAMAKMLAGQIAGDLMNACNPDFRRQIEEKRR